MKRTLIVLVVGLLAIGCLTPEQKQKALRDSVVGEYEHKEGGHKFVFLENGTAEGYSNGKKREAESKWIIVDGEIHIKIKETHRVEGGIYVLRINKDDSITRIAFVDKDEKQKDIPKEYQVPLKRIK